MSNSQFHQCQALTRAGHQCTRRAIKGQQYCWQHQPTLRRWLRRISIVAIVSILLAIIGLIADLSGLGLLPQKPQRMSGDFRIAVAGFVPEGKIESEIGVEFADGVQLRLKKFFDESNTDFTISIWGPKRIGMVHGKTREDRAQSASLIAKQRGADMVLYGAVKASNDAWILIPEFYVSSNNFHEAEEITGQHELGSPFKINNKFDVANRIEVSSELASRIQALARISIGLAFYSNRDYQTAFDHFHAAEKIKLWDDSEGREVLYLLEGNALVKNDDLEMASKYYQRAIALNPEYSRGYLGIANIYYRLALKPFEKTLNPKDIDQELLLLALENLDKSADATFKPPYSDIYTKIHFERGQIFLAQAYSGRKNSFRSSIREFEKVIASYNEGNQRIREIAGEAHARLGLIYDLTGNTDLSVKEYELAISILGQHGDKKRLAYYEKKLIDLKNNNNNGDEK